VSRPLAACYIRLPILMPWNALHAQIIPVFTIHARGFRFEQFGCSISFPLCFFVLGASPSLHAGHT
jgi:hypothetical protein